MTLNPEGESTDKWIDAVRIPQFSNDWDRLLNVYNIQELPPLLPDGEPGSEEIPISVKVLREFLLEAANAHAPEVWFDFAPEMDEYVDACFTPVGKGTTAVRMPKSLFFQADVEMGVFGFLLGSLSDDGMFAIHVNEFRDKPKPGPFDKRGRIIQPTTPPESGPPPSPVVPENEIPGVTETVTIRAFRISLKGHSIPDDLVIQICPRFWHMPTGFTVE